MNATTPAALPATMQAIEIAGPGGPETLRLARRPVPEPASGKVLVEVSHAGINRPDVLQRKGAYPPPEGASDLPGLEISGRIAALGADVEPDLLGREVCALVTGGGYAQYCLADARHCLPVPEGLDMAEAAALPETLFTVWHNVFQRGLFGLDDPPERPVLLVHGGTSGIGTMAIKLARLFGIESIVTCSTGEKCAAARAIGADHALNYRESDFVAGVKAITDGRGADLVLDMVAGDYTQRNLDCMAEDARLVTIAVLGGAKAEINMARLMVRRQTITGSTLRARPDAFKAALTQEILDRAWPFVADGALRPEIDRIFSLAEAADAHRRMEAGEHVGKIVLAMPEAG